MNHGSPRLLRLDILTATNHSFVVCVDGTRITVNRVASYSFARPERKRSRGVTTSARDLSRPYGAYGGERSSQAKRGPPRAPTAAGKAAGSSRGIPPNRTGHGCPRTPHGESVPLAGLAARQSRFGLTDHCSRGVLRTKARPRRKRYIRLVPGQLRQASASDVPSQRPAEAPRQQAVTTRGGPRTYIRPRKVARAPAPSDPKQGRG